jgi:hypothetical protein
MKVMQPCNSHCVQHFVHIQVHVLVIVALCYYAFRNWTVAL